MVTLVSRTGCILHIDSYTMGLVIIAMGTSIPVSKLIIPVVPVKTIYLRP